MCRDQVQWCRTSYAKLCRQARCKKPTCSASFLDIKITGIPLAKWLWIMMCWCLLSYFWLWKFLRSSTCPLHCQTSRSFYFSTHTYIYNQKNLYIMFFSTENQPTKTFLHQQNHTTNKQITPRHHEVRPIGPGSLGVLPLLGATSFAPSLESAALGLSKVGDMGGTGWYCWWKKSC